MNDETNKMIASAALAWLLYVIWPPLLIVRLVWGVGRAVYVGRSSQPAPTKHKHKYVEYAPGVRYDSAGVAINSVQHR
jgi:hypothetical protein